MSHRSLNAAEHGLLALIVACAELPPAQALGRQHAWMCHRDGSDRREEHPLTRRLYDWKLVTDEHVYDENDGYTYGALRSTDAGRAAAAMPPKTTLPTARQRRALRGMLQRGEATPLALFDVMGDRRDVVPILKQCGGHGWAEYVGWDTWKITAAGRKAAGEHVGGVAR